MKPYLLYPTKEFFERYLSLDYQAGKLYFKKRPRSGFKTEQSFCSWNKRFAGKEAGALTKNGLERNVCINKKIYMQHRVILVMTGWPCSLLSMCVVNHIDGDNLNNRPENLSLTPVAKHMKVNFKSERSELSKKYEFVEFPFWDYLDYCKLTGRIYLKSTCPKDVSEFVQIGLEVRHGYSVVKISCRNSQRVFSHRLAWRLHYGEWPDGFIDHIDGNQANNKIDNLRLASPMTNMKNKGIYRKNRSGLSGVRYERDRGKWVAQIGGEKLGRFDDKFEACCARLSAQKSDKEYTFRHGRA